MQKPIVNYAFIDLHNLYRSVQSEGWAVDYFRFRRYLKEKYGIKCAYMFMGYIPSQKNFYDFLEKAGFVLVLKPVQFTQSGIKGNCDAELVLQSMIDFNDYYQAVIVTGDGDFSCLVRHLVTKNKLSCVLAPSLRTCSNILRKSARRKFTLISKFKHHLSRDMKRTPEGRNLKGDFSRFERD